MINEKEYNLTEIESNDWVCCLSMDFGKFEIYQYRRRNPLKDLQVINSKEKICSFINIYSLEIQINHPSKPPTKTGPVSYSFKKISKKKMANRLIGFKIGWEAGENLK